MGGSQADKGVPFDTMMTQELNEETGSSDLHQALVAQANPGKKSMHALVATLINRYPPSRTRETCRASSSSEFVRL